MKMMTKKKHKMNYSNGLNVTNNLNLLIIINIFIEGYMKRLKAMILNLEKLKIKN